MTLQYTEKMDAAQIERVLAARPSEDESGGGGSSSSGARSARRPKRVEDEDAAQPVLHAVGTVKRVRRGTAEAIEDVRMKKASQKASEVEELFEADT